MKIIVQKQNLAGEVTWQYEGVILRREPNQVVLEAFFNRPDMPFLDVVFKQNDRFVETFYNDRWYNIFRIYDRDDGMFKGWYCNVGRPAVIEERLVSYVDLALDLWVSSDGKQTVLDQDEFEILELDDDSRRSALRALQDLKALFLKDKPPA
jgi:protein associated with RNAse G/E